MAEAEEQPVQANLYKLELVVAVHRLPVVVVVLVVAMPQRGQVELEVVEELVEQAERLKLNPEAEAEALETILLATVL
jgi:hypothetical protein